MTRCSDLYTLSSFKLGERGMDGKGGEGGLHKPLRKFVVTYTNQHKDSHTEYGGPAIEQSEYLIIKTKNGYDGKNMQNKVPAKRVDFVSPAYSINRYKKYLRVEIPNSLWESNIRDFLKSIETNTQSFYDTFSLIDDFITIENQYYQLQHKLTFAPFYHSLLYRTHEYAKLNTETKANKFLLMFLYTAILAKLYAIEGHDNRVSAVNYLTRLEFFKENLEKLTNFSPNIDEFQIRQKTFLDHKSNLATEFVKIDIKPKIFKANAEAKLKIEMLENQIIKYGNITTNDVNMADRKTELEHFIRLHQILIAEETISVILECLSVASTTVINVLDSEVLISSAFNGSSPINPQDQMKLQTSIDLIYSLISQVKNQFKNEHRLFSYELNDMKKELQKTIDSWAMPIQKKVDEFQVKIKFSLSTENTNILNPNEIDSMRFELIKLLNKSDPTSKLDKTIQNNLLNILEIANVSPNVYIGIKANAKKIEVMAQGIKRIKGRYEIWKQGQDSINDRTVTFINFIEKSIEKTNQSLSSGSLLKPNIENGYVQEFLKNLKNIFYQMREWTILQNSQSNSAAELDESMEMLVNIYDRIEKYWYVAQFSAYYMKMFSETVPDYRLLREIELLNSIIQTNRVLEQYEALIYIIRMYQFPFSRLPNAVLELPENLQPNDFEHLIHKVNGYIKYLKAHIISLNEIANDYNEGITIKVTSNPFYTWKNYENREKIEKLLSGEEITIESDILNGMHENGVKFNEISLQFISANESAQSELDEALNNFRFIIKAIGNNYYQCDSRIYYIPVDDDITIDYSLKKHKNGTPIKINEIYHKLKKEGFYLSPYTMWNIKLVSDRPKLVSGHDFNELKRFRKSVIDLQLSGSGQYFEDQKPVSLDICNENLNQFYSFDYTLTNSNFFENLKYRFLDN